MININPRINFGILNIQLNSQIKLHSSKMRRRKNRICKGVLFVEDLLIAITFTSNSSYNQVDFKKCPKGSCCSVFSSTFVFTMALSVSVILMNCLWHIRLVHLLFFKCSYNLHEQTSFLGIPDDILIQVPSTTTLQCLANHIGNSSMQLGVELGLTMSEIQNIQYEHKDKLLNQTKEILRIWLQKKAPRSTNLSLIKALHRIGKINCISMIR